MKDLFDLTGKTAVVIGVGGLGSAQALGFAEYGADVVLADYKVAHLSYIADEIQKMGRKVLTIQVQVSDEESMKKMVSKILEVFTRIDILANSAGINMPTSDEFSPMEGWQEVLDVNLKGTYLGCKIIGQEMIKQKSGKIINISSIRGWYSHKGGPLKPPKGEEGSSQKDKRPARAGSYGLSKGAINTLTRSLAVQMAENNINVNAIAPTMMETPLVQDALTNPKAAEHIKSGIPMDRWGMPEDIVGLSIFLASKASDYVTGQIIYLDGGQSCCA